MTLQVRAKPRSNEFVLGEWIDAFGQARIPSIVYKRSLSEDARLRLLYDYVNSDLYQDDIEAGLGLQIVGDLQARLLGFPALARAMVIKEDNVLYISLVELMHALTEDDHPWTDAAHSADILFVNDMYQDDQEFPFDRYQRVVIQNFLRNRFESGQRNCFHLVNSFEDVGVRWWSKDFVAYQAQYLRLITV